MPVETPGYYEYFGRTFKLDSTPSGGLQGYLLNLDTGEFDVDSRPIKKVLFATSTSDISKLTADDFVNETEELRAYTLAGEGPIFALYDTIDAMFARKDVESRGFTDQERALIKSLRRRTFAMWEDELARRAAGEPPSFTVRRKNV
ncbi:hypothetical protein [Amycolatopsis sp. YIM 10]|uniref:hypothetical protein n=1 Tax=Amycolatopsis sp. YIM 10 TaxID=2653857 RepID=UPI0012901D02|nr:hypothetical protein [Amycolatopsis sp. YIM 10]QFU94752.1 hypothetical protein YIM_48135 [Amycolatopsis sp. YIM 10]